MPTSGEEPCAGLHDSGRERSFVKKAGELCVQVYRDDDTILSWDLINEPRCERIGCDTDMLAWIEEMAPYIKALDSNHLLTVGELLKPWVTSRRRAVWLEFSAAEVLRLWHTQYEYAK